MQQCFGCASDAQHPIYIIKGELLKRCPLQLINRQSFRYMEAFRFFQRGDYPNPGEWTKQPIKFLEAMKIIDKEIAEIEAQKKKELEKMIEAIGRKS